MCFHFFLDMKKFENFLWNHDQDEENQVNSNGLIQMFFRFRLHLAYCNPKLESKKRGVK